ncbi:coproporphyrinogen III oxidase, aerobic [Gilbertella persicaria]|uniref:coproporphyrinogen III oxidase, aerobic n=1 Tax=Gilbertella persicaria TaxID=101096 RepID=UPI00221FAA4E|nr:coproporphyrinogen III oxidase, aerobic [Gilbertella persicaria]KAI8047679.1 coproporphyrinogen III oxidase, aerobic [Gilbertella persicaria]
MVSSLSSKYAIYQSDNDLRAKGLIDNKAPLRLRMEAYVKELQGRICQGIEKLDGKGKFVRSEWERAEHGGEGITCVMSDGDVMEKAGIAVSVVYSELSPEAVRQMRHDRGKDIDVQGTVPFFVTGISLVMHAKNPNAPTIHMNYRYFEIMNPDGTPKLWWFGGGADLTPVYLFEEDAILFHSIYKQGCDKFDPDYYPRMKRACDLYFLNKHRNEARGIGGIFFDDFNDKPAEEIFEFIQEMGDRFLPSYLPLLERRKDMPFTEDMVHWQQIRRGRYVEFNLIWDRGTKFGLATPCARVESILMTMPLTARWEYMHEPKKGSQEAALVQVLQNPRDWV